MNRMHEDLEWIVAEWARQWFSPEDYFRPGLHPDAVRSALAALHLDPPDDLVSLFAWRAVRPDKEYVPLFWDVFLYPLETMVETYRLNREVADRLEEEGVDPKSVWPGPPTWFPVFMMDGAEIVSVECGQEDRGSVWFAFTQSGTVRMYGSLPETIAAARHCLEAGYWRYSSKDGFVEADGRSPAWVADPVAAPWRIVG